MNEALSSQVIPPRVLIGCPTYEGQLYCIDRFLKSLSAITFMPKNVLFVDNSVKEDFAEHLHREGYRVIRNPLEPGPAGASKVPAIVSNRNIIIKTAIDENYDYLMFMDTDMLFPTDCIQRLLSHQKDICAGVYLNHQRTRTGTRIAPTLRGFSHLPDHGRFIPINTVRGSSILEVFGAAFGCILIRTEILAKVPLRYNLQYGAGEDFIFCYDARRFFGYKTFVDTSVKCVHMTRVGDLSFDSFPSTAHPGKSGEAEELTGGE